MADQKTEIKATQGVPYQGLGNSPDGDFKVNGFDAKVLVYKVDAGSNTLGSSVEIETGLKIVHAGKVIIPDGTGNASTIYTCKPGAGGKIVVAGLNALAPGAVFVLVAYGSLA